jgi:hypothetical protein
MGVNQVRKEVMKKKKAIKPKKVVAKKTTVKKTTVKKTVVQPKFKKTLFENWVTYDTKTATYRIGSNEHAHYGVFLYQMRYAEDGVWLRRIVEKNGSNEEPGPVTLMTAAQAESHAKTSVILKKELKQRAARIDKLTKEIFNG